MSNISLDSPNSSRVTLYSMIVTPSSLLPTYLILCVVLMPEFRHNKHLQFDCLRTNITFVRQTSYYKPKYEIVVSGLGFNL